MKEIIIDTLVDALKIFPFLFIVFIFMEYFEHKLAKKSKDSVLNAGKLGPLIGSILGCLPQCGFGVAATNLYATRIISLGTLISIYLATSDEMLPIMLSQDVALSFILFVLLIKVVLGMFFGFIIDFLLRKKNDKILVKDFCKNEHCNCEHEHNLLVSASKHTLNIISFIILVEFVLNIGIEYLGHDKISNLLMSQSIWSSFITSLIGLIPNCASSVIITELFINGAISFGSLISGLLTGSGIALLVLFRVNKNVKENIFITFLIYFIGAFSGLIINLLGIL